MFCPNCGKRIGNGESFCASCGIWVKGIESNFIDTNYTNVKMHDNIHDTRPVNKETGIRKNTIFKDVMEAFVDAYYGTGKKGMTRICSLIPNEVLKVSKGYIGQISSQWIYSSLESIREPPKGKLEGLLWGKLVIRS